MRSIADQIESYLKESLAVSDEGVIEIQRHELAQVFSCVPSQINYVLSTRFTVESGFLVESRRGGGGFLRIMKLRPDPARRLTQLVTSIGHELTQLQAEGVIRRLVEGGVITAREGRLTAAVTDRGTLDLPLPARDFLRARIIRALLIAVLREGT